MRITCLICSFLLQGMKFCYWWISIGVELLRVLELRFMFWIYCILYSKLHWSCHSLPVRWDPFSLSIKQNPTRLFIGIMLHTVYSRLRVHVMWPVISLIQWKSSCMFIMARPLFAPLRPQLEVISTLGLWAAGGHPSLLAHSPLKT